VIRPVAILLGVPVALTVLLAVPLGVWKGHYQWLCAGVALGLVVPPGVVTLILAERLTRGSPFGALLALAVGAVVRVVVGFGGAVVVYFASAPTFSGDPLSFLSWVLGVYLTTLIVETVLLAGSRTVQVAEPPKT
jgi:hypothetical protein